MVTPLRSDPSLKFTQRIFSALVALAAVLTIAAIGLLIVASVNPSIIAQELQQRYGDANLPNLMTALKYVLIPAIAMLILAVLFLKQLISVIKTATDGLPFTAPNIERLRSLGWLAIGFAFASLPYSFALQYFRETATQSPQALNIDSTGLLLALVLFALTRIFQRGAELEQDLEGTV